MEHKMFSYQCQEAAKNEGCTIMGACGKNPGILISGHDLKDLEMLLEQTDGTGIDVYTHSEMLPGHYYPAFKKYKHFVGNYGNAWWKQKEEFESFNGPLLLNGHSNNTCPAGGCCLCGKISLIRRRKKMVYCQEFSSASFFYFNIKNYTKFQII